MRVDNTGMAQFLNNVGDDTSVKLAWTIRIAPLQILQEEHELVQDNDIAASNISQLLDGFFINLELRRNRCANHFTKRVWGVTLQYKMNIRMKLGVYAVLQRRQFQRSSQNDGEAAFLKVAILCQAAEPNQQLSGDGMGQLVRVG
ncbi:MAG: hypothetical protein ACK5A1_05750, partial [Planctomyces sp.]